MARRKRRASRRFYPLFHLFVFTMLLAVTTDDLGLMWVAVEGTTLASVFLVSFHRTRASLEAAYKYLLICSVGIALAFVGTVFVYFADAQRLGAENPRATVDHPAPLGPHAAAPGAGAGLRVPPRRLRDESGARPMHTWLPDAHSEAPCADQRPHVGRALSVGIYAVLRFKTVVDLAAGPGFSRRLLVLFGLGSMAVAAAFLWSPTNFKRMLAYSSVEHLGLVCLGLGFRRDLGRGGSRPAPGQPRPGQVRPLLLSGRIRDAYGTVEIPSVRGLLVTMPVTGRGFFVALLALLGLPPFGLFISELLIFGAGFREGWGFAAALGLVLLLIAFGGLLRALHHMAYGVSGGLAAQETLTWKGAAPIAVALSLLVLTGTAWPPGLAAALERVAAVMGG